MPLAFAFTEYGNPQARTFLDLPRPTPGPGQLLVAVRASGVNPIDWKIAAGYLRAYVDLPLPAVFGTEIAGTVEEIGEGVEGFAVGDEVFGRLPLSGGYAEFALISAQSAALKPSGLAAEVAATLPVAGGAGYDGLTQLDLDAGDTLLVVGAGGGVGVATLQIARSRGITVIGMASAGKKNLIESLDAIHVPYDEDPAATIRALTPNGV